MVKCSGVGNTASEVEALIVPPLRTILNIIALALHVGIGTQTGKMPTCSHIRLRRQPYAAQDRTRFLIGHATKLGLSQTSQDKAVRRGVAMSSSKT